MPRPQSTWHRAGLFRRPSTGSRWQAPPVLPPCALPWRFSPAGTGQEYLWQPACRNADKAKVRRKFILALNARCHGASLLESTRLFSLPVAWMSSRQHSLTHFRNSCTHLRKKWTRACPRGEPANFAPPTPRVLRIWLGRVRFCYHCRGSTFAARDRTQGQQLRAQAPSR